MDGGDLLSAKALHLSYRCAGRFAAIRNFQGDGAAADQGHHEPGDDDKLGARILSRLVGLRFFWWLAARKNRYGRASDCDPCLFHA